MPHRPAALPPRPRAAVTAALLLALGAGPAQALDIAFDYSLDTSGFFGTQARRDLMDAAAAVFEGRLQDSLTAITSGGGNSFNISPVNPATGATTTVSSVSIAAGELRVFLGGRDLGAGTLGVGGPGGWSGSATSSAFFDNAEGRGQAGALLPTPTDFAPWGGSISFSTTTSWYTDPDPQTTEAFGGFDLYSVAIHELAHVLGYGTADAWAVRVSGSQFLGTAAGLQPLSADGAHWAAATLSDVDGVAQAAAMGPSIGAGQRKRFTTLDYQGLQDIGWEVSAVPEPGTWLMWAAGLGLVGGLQQRRRRQTAA